MSAIKILVDEHEEILRMINVSKVILSNKQADDFDINNLEKVIDFIQNFADKYHHMKEEDELFVEMNNHGIPVNGGPIGVMLHEHNLGRAFVKQTLEAIALYKSGDLLAIDAIRESLRGYGDLLKNHIYKENNILYPMAEKALPLNILEKMCESFELKNSSTINNEYYDKYLRMANELSDIYL